MPLLTHCCAHLNFHASPRPTFRLSFPQTACSTTEALASDQRFQVVRRLLASNMSCSAPPPPAWIVHFYPLSSATRRLTLFTPFLTLVSLAPAVLIHLGFVVDALLVSTLLSPLLPPEFRRQAFDTLHALSHPGIRGSHCLVASRLLWPGMNKDFSLWASSCLDCQMTKVARHVCLPVQRINVLSPRFSHVHVDLVGPLPSVHGFTHVFTIVDRSTCWPATYPIQDTSAATCYATLIEWISGLGVPATLTSDRSSQFMSSSWSAFCRSLGMEHVMTTAYHPQSYGMVERMHRRLKAALVAPCSSASWPSKLP